MDVPRARIADLLERAKAAGPFGDMPVNPEGLDPQVHVSCNDRDEPFSLICERDVLLAVMNGTGRVVFADATVHVREYELVPGDLVYVPARIPHRVLATAPVVLLRLRGAPAGMEACAWFCDLCGTEISRREFDAESELRQRVYLDACAAFNASNRACPACGAVQSAVDLGDVRWDDIAAGLVATDDDEQDAATH